jgi:cell division protein FtsL
VVLARHQSRKLFVELQALEQQRDAMNDEWGQLLLEQATWGTHGRVEDIARTKLGMMVPSTGTVILVAP